LGELGEFASFPPGRGAAGGQPASQGPNELAASRGNLANSPNPPNSPRGDAPETSGGADPPGAGVSGGRNPAYQPFLRPKRAGGKLRAANGRDSVEERGDKTVD
jgi:hypothetical protein